MVSFPLDYEANIHLPSAFIRGRIMTEREIQYRLWYYRACISTNLFMVPNAFIWHWEADLLYVTPSGFATEWEIKLSRSDFKADFKKTYKHLILNEGKRPSGEPAWDSNKIKHDIGPKYFYYACPEGLIKAEEVPEYAGLFYIYETGASATLIKQAPRRKVKPLTDKQKIQLYEKGLRRYWSTQEKMYFRQVNNV